MVIMLDLRLSVLGSIPSHDTAGLFLRYVTVFCGYTTLGYSTTLVNSVLHSSGVAKSSTSFSWE